MIPGSLAQALIQVRSDLNQLAVRWALIDGLAVSSRAEPRTTRDLDVVLAIDDDRATEAIVRSLRRYGYRLHSEHLENEGHDRLAQVRLLVPGGGANGIAVDLLVAHSGVEQEIVSAAETLELLPGVFVPVARTGHLIALKVLAFRPQDQEDARSLLRVATPKDLSDARDLLDLVERRGFYRGEADLLERLTDLERRVEQEPR